MADGDAVKQFAEEVVQEVGEMAKEVKNEVGQALEQGAQSVVGTQPTPQQMNNPTASEQQKQLEDQKKIAETRRKIAFYQQVDQAQKMVRQQNKQKQIQKQQIEMQEQQAKKVQGVQQQQAIKTPGQPPLREDLARTQVERSKGRGVGG